MKSSMASADQNDLGRNDEREKSTLSSRLSSKHSEEILL